MPKNAMVISTASYHAQPAIKVFQSLPHDEYFLPILDRVNGITTVGRPTAQIYGFILTLVKI